MKLKKINESYLDNIKETILIPTGLYGKDDLAIFDSLSGQISDGMWENSPRMGKFWQYMDFVLDENDQVMIRVPKNYQWYFGWETNQQWFKTWIANHLKQLVKEYIKDNDGEWSRDCTTRFDGWFHKPEPSIQDVYRVYDKLLGRKDRIDKYSYIESYEPSEDEHMVDLAISWLFEHESLYEKFCEYFDYSFNEETGEEINKPDFAAVQEWTGEALPLYSKTALEDYDNYMKDHAPDYFDPETFIESYVDELAYDIDKVIVNPGDANVKISNVEWNTWDELSEKLPTEFYIKVDPTILNIEDKEEFDDEIYDYILDKTGFMMEAFTAENLDKDLVVESAKLNDMVDLEKKIRSVMEHKPNDDWHDGRAYLFEIDGYDKNFIKHFDDGDVDFNKLEIYERTPEELEEGKSVATFMISGGKNGSGDWADYISKLEERFKELKSATGCIPVLYKLDTDLCDDVWTGYVFLYANPKQNESLTESVHTLLTEGCWGMPYTLERVNKLKKLMQKPVDAFTVGDCANYNDELGIGDDSLFDNISDYRHKHKYGSKEANDVRKVIQKFIKDEVLPNWDGYSYSSPEGDSEGHTWENGVKEVFQEIADMDLEKATKEWEKEKEEAEKKDAKIKEVAPENIEEDLSRDYNVIKIFSVSDYAYYPEKGDVIYKTRYNNKEGYLNNSDRLALYPSKHGTRITLGNQAFYPFTIFFKSPSEAQTFVNNYCTYLENKGASWATGQREVIEVCPARLSAQLKEEGLVDLDTELGKCMVRADGAPYDVDPSGAEDTFLEDIEKHNELNQKLFNGEELKPEVKETIEKIAKEFLDELANDGIKFDLKDIILIGSNVSYNYNKDSDLDIHLIADSSNLTCPDNLYPLLYSAYRSMFNHNYDIKIKGIPAEIFVEMDECNATSNGIYSIKDGWIKKPVQQKVPDLDQEAFDKLFTEWEDKYFDLINSEGKKEKIIEGKSFQTFIFLDEDEEYIGEASTPSDAFDEVINNDNIIFVKVKEIVNGSEEEMLLWERDVDTLDDLRNSLQGSADPDCFLEDLDRQEEIIEELNRKFDVTDTSWADGIYGVTKLEALKFIEENARKSTYNWFVKHFDEIEKEGYLTKSNIDVEMLDEEPEAIVEDLHPEINLGWTGKGKRHPVDADTFTTKKKGDTITVHVSDDLPDLEYEVKDGSYLDDEAVADSPYTRDTLSNYEPTRDSGEKFNSELTKLVKDSVKAEIADTIRPEYRSEPTSVYTGGSWGDVPTSIHIEASNKRRVPTMYADGKEAIVESNLKEERSDDIYDFINAIYALRKDSIAKEGEYGLGNLVFKEFRNLGYMDNLRRLRREAKSKELSLESLDEMKEAFSIHKPMTKDSFETFKAKHPEYRFEEKELGTLIFKGEDQIGTYLDKFGEIWLNEEKEPEKPLEEKSEYIEEYDNWDLDEGKKKRIVDYRRLANLPDDAVITEENLDEQALNNTCRINYDYPKDKLIKELLN